MGKDTKKLEVGIEKFRQKAEEKSLTSSLVDAVIGPDEDKEIETLDDSERRDYAQVRKKQLLAKQFEYSMMASEGNFFRRIYGTIMESRISNSKEFRRYVLGIPDSH